MCAGCRLSSWTVARRASRTAASGAVRGPHTGQVKEAIWGHVYIVQSLVMDPTARRPRRGDGS